MFSQKFEFFLTYLNFCKVKTDSELGVCDATCSKFIKVTEELTNSCASLWAKLSDTSADIFNILRGISYDLGLTNSRTSLGEVIEAVIVVLTNSKQSCCTIYFLAEINVVNLINVTFVHIPS